MVNNVFLKFQPTPLMWGRQNYAKSLQVDYLFQLMPPCAGGDSNHGRGCDRPPNISIHAPVWRVTGRPQDQCYRSSISIHTPYVGGDMSPPAASRREEVE